MKNKSTNAMMRTTAYTLIKKRCEIDNEPYSQYVKDSIDYGMKTCITICYSQDIFSLLDSVSLKDNTLRIFKLNLDDEMSTMDQLHTQAAIFCLDYEIDPRKIEIELRLYHNNEVITETPDSEKIVQSMRKLIVLATHKHQKTSEQKGGNI